MLRHGALQPSWNRYNMISKSLCYLLQDGCRLRVQTCKCTAFSSKLRIASFHTSRNKGPQSGTSCVPIPLYRPHNKTSETVPRPILPNWDKPVARPICRPKHLPIAHFQSMFEVCVCDTITRIRTTMLVSGPQKYVKQWPNALNKCPTNISFGPT